MRALVFGLFVMGSVACRKPGAPLSAVSGPDGLAALRGPVHDPLRARFSFKIASPPLGLQGGAGGALIVDRPGRLHFAVLGPLGAALATAQTDGNRASIEVRRQSQHYWADQVEATVRRWTGDELGADGVVGLFVGQVPEPASPGDLVSANDGTLSYVVGEPDEGSVHVTLEGTPPRPRAVRIVDVDGSEQLTLTYEEFVFSEVGAVPSGWSLSAPALELALDVKFKSYEPIEQVPAVFGTAAPEGFASTRIAEVVRMIEASR